ncbi:hypothetical protein [Metarhizobium album]|uniref:hypothetical protein n=1 Tax=Metarhizobium album TaxID=2182425 RepID=UPI000FFE9B2F|nr:hypothetical protein [Rhizobium album]
MMDFDARSVARMGGYCGEFRLSAQSAWRRVKSRGRDAIFSSAYEAEAKAWRAARDLARPRVRAETYKVQPSARETAEQLFGTKKVR